MLSLGSLIIERATGISLDLKVPVHSIGESEGGMGMAVALLFIHTIHNHTNPQDSRIQTFHSNNAR